MHRLLRNLSWLVLIAALVLWILTGANRGWTKTTVPVTVVDEVTGIEAVDYRHRFMPGIDFLGAAALGAALLAIGSLLFRRRELKPD